MGQQAGVESRHRTDPVVGQGEDQQPDRVQNRRLRVADVDAESGLAVGPRRDQPGSHVSDGRRDGFPGFEPCLRPGGSVHKLIEEQVRAGLEPEHLPKPGWLGQAFRQQFVATRYSHVRTEARSSKPPSPCQADSRVSCSPSSAS